jgi:hypothetical protein
MRSDGQFSLACGCGEIGTAFPFRKIEKLRGKGKGGFPGFPAGFFRGSLIQEFNHLYRSAGGEGKNRFVGFVEGFQILGFGFRRSHF